MFGATSTVKYSDQKKYVYSGYGIKFKGTGLWSFDNDYARNVIVLIILHYLMLTIKKNIIFWILGACTTFGINRKFSSAEKKLRINFTKANTNFFLVWIIMLILVICLLMEKKSLNLKPTIKMLTFNSILFRKCNLWIW